MSKVSSVPPPTDPAVTALFFNSILAASPDAANVLGGDPAKLTPSILGLVTGLIPGQQSPATPTADKVLKDLEAATAANKKIADDPNHATYADIRAANYLNSKVNNELLSLPVEKMGDKEGAIRDAATSFAGSTAGLQTAATKIFGSGSNISKSATATNVTTQNSVAATKKEMDTFDAAQPHENLEFDAGAGDNVDAPPPAPDVDKPDGENLEFDPQD